MRIKLLRLALCLVLIGLVAFILTYFCFHFVTDEGITLTWHPEAGKPFVTLFLGVFATVMVSASAVSALSAVFLFPRGEGK